MTATLVKKIRVGVWKVIGGPQLLTRLRMINMAKRLNVEVSILRKEQYTGSSKMEITVVIPAIQKDLSTLPYVVDSIKKYLQHPIREILIISPDNRDIKEFCKENNCVFVNEETVLPLKVKDIDYKVGGDNRAGWLYQQMLKLNADQIVKTDNYIVMDADTVITKPLVFEDKDKIIFDCSDERHVAYYRMFEKLLGTKITSNVSFVSHHILINEVILTEMKRKIEEVNGCNWIKSILIKLDKNELSGFSEFETYGNYFLGKYPERMILRYWDNYEVGFKEVMRTGIEEIIKKYEGKYLTISFHSYNLNK